MQHLKTFSFIVTFSNSCLVYLHLNIDRDSFVKINEKNILEGQEHNFEKYSKTKINSLGEQYDYRSIMHYGINTYSIDFKKETITPLQNNVQIGQRKRLSFGDISQAKKLYRCVNCGRTFLNRTKTFVSPSYSRGANVTHPERCEWRITRSHGERIVLEIIDLKLFESDDCQVDYIEIRDGYYSGAQVIRRLCGTHRSKITVVSMSNRMIVTYSAKNTKSIGFKAKYKSICGGNLTITSGDRIETPNYPFRYHLNQTCIWIINVPTNYSVAIEFETFNIEDNSNNTCAYDYIEVRDGSSMASELITNKRYCGIKKPPILISTKNQMFIKFVSDGTNKADGFSAKLYHEFDECKSDNHGCQQQCINTIGGYSCACKFGYELADDRKSCLEVSCGGVIKNKQSGEIRSPSFPESYPSNKRCTWRIEAPESHHITINFTHFNLEGSQMDLDCEYDVVQIESLSTNQSVVDSISYCRDGLPMPVTSATNIMQITFESDETVEKSGFTATFFAHVINYCRIDNGGCAHICQEDQNSFRCLCNKGFALAADEKNCIPTNCSHVIIATRGEITSENYPQNYSKNINCFWEFLPPPGHRIILEFSDLDLEDSYDCTNDFVRVSFKLDAIAKYKDNRNGGWLRGDLKQWTLGKFCGQFLPEPIVSPAGRMFMAFKTDNNIQKKGFKMAHSTICGGHFDALPNEQIIYSHARYGVERYESDIDCEWIIQTLENRQIHLRFHFFDIEEEQTCRYDFVDIYDGGIDRTGEMYGRFCGTHIPKEIISKRTSLLLRFHSDSTFARKGFNITYSIANSINKIKFNNGSSSFLRLGTPIIDRGRYDSDLIE